MKIYHLLDRLFDPLPKELRKSRDKASIMLYYEAKDEDYKRYKHLGYRKLLLNSALAFVLGLLMLFLLKF